MVRNGTPEVSALRRALALLEAVIADGGLSNLSVIARDLAMPVSSAHRHAATLIAAGYLRPLGGGRHAAGPALARLADQIDDRQIVVNAAAAVLHRLAERSDAIVQLGTYENEMVTYRIKSGRGASGLFTRVGMQLEAYCSGIGKVLLANLTDAERAAYLATGPFVALTARTICDAGELGRVLETVRAQGFATDLGEVVEDLACVAVPLRRPDGEAIAAISITRLTARAAPRVDPADLAALRAAAAEIETLAFG